MRALAGLLTVFALVWGLSIESGAAVGSVLYLLGDPVPSSSMSASPPPAESLPNFDLGRDSFAGLLVQKGSGSVDENDPTKYQQWSHPVGGETLNLGEFVIWAAPKDFDGDKTVVFNVYALDCGGSCQVLDGASATVSGDGWSRLAVPLDVTNHTFAAGRSVRVKVVVDVDSDDDMWFAYATATYPANLTLTSPPATTTTTTTTTTTPATTSSTSPGVSPPSPPKAPEPTATSTTVPHSGDDDVTTTTIRVPAQGGFEPRPPSSNPDIGSDDDGSAPLASSEPGGFAPVVASPAQDDVGLMARALGSRTIEPEEGLMVAFSTAVEAIRIHWMSALALGTLTAILLLVGTRGDREHESLATTAPLPNHLSANGWRRRPDH